MRRQKQIAIAVDSVAFQVAGLLRMVESREREARKESAAAEARRAQATAKIATYNATRCEVQKRIRAFIKRSRRATIPGVSKALGVDVKLVGYHVREMSKAGAIVAEDENAKPKVWRMAGSAAAKNGHSGGAV